MKDIEEYFIAYAPERYRNAISHYIDAHIELLKAVDELIKLRIEELEGLKEFRRKEVKREKVGVE